MHPLMDAYNVVPECRCRDLNVLLHLQNIYSKRILTHDCTQIIIVTFPAGFI